MTLFPGIERIQPGPSSAAYHRTLSPHKEISTPFDIKKKRKENVFTVSFLGSVAGITDITVAVGGPAGSPEVLCDMDTIGTRHSALNRGIVTAGKSCTTSCTSGLPSPVPSRDPFCVIF